MSHTRSFMFGSLIDLIRIHSSGLGLDMAYVFSFTVLLFLFGFLSKFPCICPQTDRRILPSSADLALSFSFLDGDLTEGSSPPKSSARVLLIAA